MIDDVAMAVEQPPRRLRRGAIEIRGGNDSGRAGKPFTTVEHHARSLEFPAWNVLPRILAEGVGG